MIFITLVKNFYKEHKKLVISYISISIIAYFLKIIINSILVGKLTETENFYKILTNISITWIVLLIIYIIRTRLENEIIPKFLSFIRKSLLKNLLNSRKTNFNEINISADINRILELTRYMRDLFYWIIQYFIPSSITSLFITFYILNINCKLGSISIILQIFNFLLFSHFIPILMRESGNRETYYYDMINKLDENFNNLFNIYINNKVEDTIKNNDKIEEEYTEVYIKQSNAVEKFSTYFKLNNYGLGILSIIYMYSLFKNKKIEKKQFISILIMYIFFMNIVDSFSEELPQNLVLLGNIKNSEKFLESIMKSTQTQKNKLNNVRGEIVFDNINFSYDKNKKETLKNFNMKIEPSKKTAIIGRSGLGKTTLIKLLLNFYKPQSGKILVDNHPIDSIDPDNLRNHINYISQRTTLFNTSILENIKYGNNKNDEKVVEIVKKYNLDKILGDLNKKVENNGANISLGMQKVIFLLRGLLKDSSIYIFDEPLTSIDKSTRQSVISLINQEISPNKTVIIITHDNEILKIVDNVIDLNTIV